MLHPLSSAAIWTHEIGHYFTSQQLDTFHLVNYGLDELNRFHDELESKTCHWTFYLLDLIGESREAKWDMANCNFDVDEYEKWVAQGELVHLELVENEQYQKFYNKLKEVTE